MEVTLEYLLWGEKEGRRERKGERSREKREQDGAKKE